MRTDERFREQISRLLSKREGRRESRHERLRGVTRSDVPVDVIVQFLGMFANGVAFARVADDPLPNLDELVTLIETVVAPR